MITAKAARQISRKAYPNDTLLDVFSKIRQAAKMGREEVSVRSLNKAEFDYLVNVCGYSVRCGIDTYIIWDGDK